MKKIFSFGFIVGLLCLNNAFGGKYTLEGSGGYRLYGDGSGKNVGAVQKAWGAPRIDETIVQDSIREPRGFRIKEGWACCTSRSWEDVSRIGFENRTEANTIEVKDDIAIIAFVAREIYEHGGKFCLTQLAAHSSTCGFYIYNQQPNWPGMPCMVLCEPGWDGAYCGIEISSLTDKDDIPCDTTDITTHIENTKKSVYSGNDAITFHEWRMGVADTLNFFARARVGGVCGYEHVVYLGATDFMQHGITAQPMLVNVAGDDRPPPYGLGPTVINSGPAIGGKVKTLCAQGFTKLSDGKCVMNSKNCGSNAWCTGYSDAKYDPNKHEKKMNGLCNVIICKDRSKALDDNFDCREFDGTQNGQCEDTNSSLYGRFVSCAIGEIVDSKSKACKCVKAKSVSKEIMKYGPRGRNTDNVNEQCWTKETGEKFEKCVRGE